MRRLLLELLGVVHDPLDAIEIVLDLGNLADEPAERLLDADDVTEYDTRLRGGDGEPRPNGEEGDNESEKDTHQVQPDPKPALIRDRQPVRAVELYSQTSFSFARA